MYKRALASIELIVLSLIIFLLPFQNTIIGSSSLGFLGKSPSFIFIFLFLLCSFLRFSCSVNRVSRLQLFVLFSFFIINLISGVYYFDDISYGRSLFFKGVNLFVLNVLFLFPFFSSVKFDRKEYKVIFFIAFSLSIAGVILGDILHLDFIEYGPFQMSERVSPRPRGFSYESSMLAATIFPLLFSFFCLKNKSKDYNIYTIFILFVVALFTSSKGAIVTLIIASAFSYFFSRKLLTIKGLAFFAVFFLFVTILSSVLIELFLIDITNNTSVATRMVCVFTAFFSLLENPFGVGYFGFLHAFEINVPRAIDFINSISPVSLNMYEARGYITATSDAAIGTKSFFWNNIIYFGWPFVVVFLLYVIDIIKKCRRYNRKDLELSFWFVVISLFSFVEGVGLYSISLFIAVLNYEIKKDEGLYIRAHEEIKVKSL